jgi:DNA-binding FrmR family transcriptional regulator
MGTRQQEEGVMDIGTKQSLVSRLTRIGGQVDGIRRMVAEDRHGVDVIHQIAAAQAALGKVGAILKAEIESGLVDAVASGDTEERKEKVNELMQVFSRYGHIRER